MPFPRICSWSMALPGCRLRALNANSSMWFPQGLKIVGFGTPSPGTCSSCRYLDREGRGLGNAAEGSLFPPVDSLIPAPYLGAGLAFGFVVFPLQKPSASHDPAAFLEGKFCFLF